MTKFTFLVYHRDYEAFLQELKNAGVVHIIEKTGESEAEDEVLTGLFRKLEAYQAMNRFLSGKESFDGTPTDLQDPDRLLEHIVSLRAELEKNEQHIQALEREVARLEPWGDFSAEDDIEPLREAGYRVSFHVTGERRFQESWRERYPVEIIGKSKGMLYFVVIHRSEVVPDIDAEEVKLPDRSLSGLKAELDSVKHRSQDISSEIVLFAGEWRSILSQGARDLMDRIRTVRVKKSTGEQAEGKVKVLEGWVPGKEKDGLLKLLENKECYYYHADPEPEEKVPVKLENKKFGSLFEPISRLFDLPKYQELDLTPFFAPFFMLFFGFCLGDAGYGLLFILAGFLLKRKVAPRFRPILTLGQYLGIGTIIFGALSGTFFGINLIDTGYLVNEQTLEMWRVEQLPSSVIENLQELNGEHFDTRDGFLETAARLAGDSTVQAYQTTLLKHTQADISLLGSFRHLMQDSLSMFYLSVILGGLQILFGMILKIVNITRQKGFNYSLSILGWVVLALTLIIFKGGDYAGLLSLENLSYPFYALLAASLVLIFLFNNPRLNVFLRIGNGLWETYNVVTGVFGDLLSYIRLFALGISSAILGFVFNDMASQFLSISYVGWLLFLILLAFGHGINLFMAALGGFIHPMRLTFVEFYKNAGFKGGGKPYQPFGK